MTQHLRISDRQKVGSPYWSSVRSKEVRKATIIIPCFFPDCKRSEKKMNKRFRAHSGNNALMCYRIRS